MSARGTEMKSCYLIRHGKPDFPGGERMCLGRTDLPLSAVGRMEAALLAEYFPRRDAVLFSSPLRRAAETAAQFARPVSVLPGLAEMDAGEWDGLSFTEIRSRWPELYARRAHERVPPPGGGKRGRRSRALYRRYGRGAQGGRRRVRSDALGRRRAVSGEPWRRADKDPVRLLCGAGRGGREGAGGLAASAAQAGAGRAALPAAAQGGGDAAEGGRAQPRRRAAGRRTGRAAWAGRG